MADRWLKKAPSEFQGSVGVRPKESAFGVYELAAELDFGGNVTITTTDNGLVKTVATLPANSQIIEAYMLVTEAFDSDDEKGLDLVVASTTPSAADTAMTATAAVITAAELKSSASGAVNTFISANFSGAGAGDTTVVNSGAGTHLCLINTDGSNAADAIQTGKLVVYVKYMGNGPPTINNDV